MFLKQNFPGRKKTVKFAAIAGLLLFLVSSLTAEFFFTPKRADAANIDLNSVNATLAVSNNQANVASGNGVSFKATLTLNSPSQIALSNIVPGGPGAGPTGSGGDLLSGTYSLMGVNVGVVSKAQSSSACKTFTGLVTSNLFRCDFIYTTDDWYGATWSQNQTLTFNVNLSASDLQKLGVQYSDSGVSTEIYVYGNLELIDNSGNLVDGSFQTAKSFYVQGFNTATEAQNASTNTNVPQNGSVSSTPSSNGNDGLIKLLNEVISFIFAFIENIVYWIFGAFILPLMNAVLSISVYKDNFVAVIYPGWIVVRNVCNIFFIISLITIALATLFRVESYQYRHLLVSLVVAALLVNFSLVIGQAVLGLADTLQAQFLGHNQQQTERLAQELMVNSRSVILNYSASQNSASSAAATYNNDTLAGTVQAFFWLAMSLGAFGVFCAIVIFLTIRVVALWILLLISPVAYACGVLPATSHYREEWWKNFLKYAFFTPIMAFFLNMAVVMVTNAKNSSILTQVANNSSLANTHGIANLVLSIGSDVLLLVFLLVSLKVADMAGIYGASGITNIAKRGLFLPFTAAGKVAAGGAGILGGYGGRKWNEWTSNIRGHEERIPFWRAAAFAALNPVAFTKGLSKQSEERSHRAQAKAEAAGLEMAEQRASSLKAIFIGSYKINPHVLQHEKEEEDKHVKELQNLSRAEIARRMHQIAMMGNNLEEKAAKRGVYKLAMSKGFIDDAVGETASTEEGQKIIDKMLANHWLHTDDFDTSDLTDKNGNKVIQKEDGTFSVRNKATGQVSAIGRKDIALVANSHSTRRAFQMAMFGGELHREYVNKTNGTRKNKLGAGDSPDDYELTETYHINDHAAARLITQEGETEAKATGHLEYMTDMVTEPGTGEYTSYALRRVKDDITGKDMWVSDGEKNMAAAELAKYEGRRGAQIAWHSIISSDGQNFSKDNFAVWVKYVKDNPGFLQERMANKLITGSASATDQQVVDNAKSFRQNLTLNLESNFAKNLKIMWEMDQEATKTLLAKFSGLKRGDKGDTLDNRLATGKIVIKDNQGNETQLGS